ncbi:hypothetical protein B9Z55_027982 [Caenorhabditis nigoni]|uniref:Uncharacterized protein n=1 Tax=Caenorhabditis nigoni TaxID=1611254 RepID=A0A2G5SE19_9PELO|nr:hypothetical protein B9Z55_027982 [Caenorhabditis nigoni]
MIEDKENEAIPQASPQTIEQANTVADLAPRRRLRSADAPTIIQRGTGTQGTPATSTTNQIASWRRSPSGRSKAPFAPRRRLAPTSRMVTILLRRYSKTKKAIRKRPAPYKAFGCPRRRYTKDSGKRSSGVAAASTTVASSGGHGRGRVATRATTGRAQGNDSTAPSSRGREKSSATNAPINTRKRGSQISTEPLRGERDQQTNVWLIQYTRGKVGLSLPPSKWTTSITSEIPGTGSAVVQRVKINQERSKTSGVVRCEGGCRGEALKVDRLRYNSPLKIPIQNEGRLRKLSQGLLRPGIHGRR